MVNRHLRAVGKIAELRFPNGELLGRGASVSVFIRQYGFFVKNTVNHGERCLVFRHVFQRGVNAQVVFLPLRVVQHGMAVRERAAPRIFARNAHGRAVGNHAGVGNGFCHAPIYRLLAFCHGFALLNHALGGVVQAKVFGYGGEFFG